MVRGDWSEPPVIWALLLFPETTLGCGPREALLRFAVKVITRVAPLKPPAGMMNGPHWGVAEPAAGCSRELTLFPLMTMLFVDLKLKLWGSVSVTLTAWAASVLSFSTVIT